MRRELTVSDLTKIAEGCGTDPSVRAVWNVLLPEILAEGAQPTMSGEGAASALADIYATRMRHLQRIGCETGGIPETVQALRQEPGRVRGVRIVTSRHHALCFLTPDLARMVGFLYVKKDMNSPDGEAAEAQFELT